MSRRGSICTVPCGVGYGLGGLGSCGPVPVYGGGLDCGPVACSVQLSGSEVVIQPPPSVVTLPGPIVSASPDPVAVGQTTSSYGYGYPALGSAGGLSGGYPALGSAGGLSGGYPALGSAGGLSGGYPAQGSVGGLYGGNRRLGYGGGYGGRYGFGYCGGYGSGYGRRSSQRCLPYYWSDTCGPC